MPSYYEKNEKVLNKLLREYKEDLNLYQMQLFDRSSLVEIYNYIWKSAMKHQLREYQLKALYMADCLTKYINNLIFKELFESIEIIEDGQKEKTLIPFATFEMATGSGKTLLMGAIMYFLNKMYGVDNFLVITPPAKMEIYYKTIRNFQKKNSDTIWADDVLCNFNIITGDNFNEPSIFYTEKDFNIFIFNIDKFREGATKTKLVNENAMWRDKQGNSISLHDFLKNKKLMIFTDEAHHNQNESGALQIIKNFHPKAVLEFTATAREDETGKKEQKVIYKYNIKNLLEDKYCKLVRAFGVSSEKFKRGKELLPLNEKIKLFAIFLIHIAKKYCVQFDKATRDLKPLCFIKINRSIEDGTVIYAYLQKDLCNEKDIIKLTLNEIEKDSAVVSKVISEVIEKIYKKNIENLLKDIEAILKNSIYYHSDSPKEVKNVYANIQHESIPCELVVYHKILDEGIDLPNIYTIGVINDANTDLLVPVKQIIGRGVRLNKPLREFDDEVDLNLIQTEIVHVVCDKSKNFEKVIIDLQNHFGVSDKYLGIDKQIKEETNTCDSRRLERKYFPRIRASLKVKQDSDIFILIENAQLIVTEYIKDNCFKDEYNGLFLKYRPESLFTEVDIFADEKIFHEEILRNNGAKSKFVIDQKVKNDIIQRIIKDINCIPDIKRSRDTFNAYFAVFESQELNFYACGEDDFKICQNKFVNTFCFFFKNYIESKYYDLKFENLLESDVFPLKEVFKEYNINRIVDDKNVAMYLQQNDERKLKEVISNCYYFSQFKYSYFHYAKFDSLPELKTAELLEKVIEQEGSRSDFWIRNEQKIYLEYGSHRYYPDFLLFLKDICYVLETKGEKFSHKAKNILLNKLNELEKFRGVLLYEQTVEKLLNKRIYSLEEILEISKAYQVEFESIAKKPKEKAIEPEKYFVPTAEEPLFYKEFLQEIEVPDEFKYKEYLPIYSLAAAAGKFGEGTDAHEEGWIKVDIGKELSKKMFATKVRGHSMEPLIPHNSYCVFMADVVGSRQGKIVLCQHHDITDPDSGGKYTVKRYKSEKKFNQDGTWEHEKIILESLSKEYKPIILPTCEEGEFKIIAEFIEVIK